MQEAELKTVAAKAVIMATPKFITRRIVQGLPDKQSDAMHQIRYIPICRGEPHLRQAGIQQELRHLVPGKHVHRFHRGGLGRPQPARLQAEIQHPHLLHADERGRPRLPAHRIGARKNAASVLDDFQKLFRVRTWIPSKSTFTAAAILFICPRPASTPKCNPWCGNRWTACSSPTRIRKARNPRPARPSRRSPPRSQERLEQPLCRKGNCERRLDPSPRT